MRRRVVVWIIAAVLVAAALLVVVLRNDSGGTATGDDSTPEASTTIASSTTAAATTTSETSTTAGATTTTVEATTTTAAAGALAVTIDLNATLPRLEPVPVASYPIEPPGDLFPTAYATIASGNRIVLLDDVTGVVRFIDGATMQDIAQYPTEVPTIGSQAFVNGYFFVGPDDVLYLNEGNSDPNPSLVAYARTGNTYTEVARQPHGVGDSTLMLGSTGVTAVGALDPIMLYVGVDGQPSGAALEAEALTFTSPAKDVYNVVRAGRTWTVTYVFPPDAGLPPSDGCVLCASAELGPGNTVVLRNQSPGPGGDLQTKVTVLSDQAITYDTEWEYIGTLGNKMLFDRLDQDSIDFGTFEV